MGECDHIVGAMATDDFGVTLHTQSKTPSLPPKQDYLAVRFTYCPECGERILPWPSEDSK